MGRAARARPGGTRLRDIDRLLETTKIAHNRLVWNRILDLPPGSDGPADKAAAPDHDAALKRLIQLPDAAFRAAGAEDCAAEAQRARLLAGLRFKTVLKADPALRDSMAAARRILSEARFDLAGARVDHGGLLEAVTTHPDKAVRDAAQGHRRTLEARLHPLAQGIADRRNALARAGGFADFPAWTAAQNGLGLRVSATLLHGIDRATAATVRAYIDGPALAGGGADAGDLYFALETAPRLGLRAAPARAQLRADLIAPAFQRMCRVLGFGDKPARIRVRTVDLPINGLTVLVAPPEQIFVISAPFNSFRCWRVMFHEFGHALSALFNDQPGYAFKWQDAPCFQEAMAQLINHFALDRDSLTALFGSAPAAFRHDQWLIDLCRLRMWLASARAEAQLYGGGDRADAAAALPETGESFDSVYTIFYPFHFQNMVLGDLLARVLKAAAPDRPADWLIARFYAPGSSVDWRRRVLHALGQPADGPPETTLAALLTARIPTLFTPPTTPRKA